MNSKPVAGTLAIKLAVCEGTDPCGSEGNVVQFALSVPPHPGPLPWGEGAQFGREKRSSRNLMIWIPACQARMA